MKAQFEKVPTPDDSSFACIPFSGQNYDCPYHFHPECEILRIDGSHGITLIGDSFGEYYEGQWYLFGPDLPHLFKNRPAPRGNRSWAKSRVIQFRTDCLGEAFFAQREVCHIEKLLQRAKRGILFGDAVEPQASRLLNQIFRTDGMKRLLGWLKLLELLATQHDIQYLASASYQPTQDHAGFERLAGALETIHKQYQTNIDQSILARSVGMSASAFSHAFKKYLNMPYSRYLNAYRISQVRRELIETEVPITEIAFRNGFNNLSHFNRQFLRLSGVSPRAYRSARFVDA